MSSVFAGHKKFHFTVRGLPPATFSVVEFTGTERLNGLYRFDLTLVSEDPSVVGVQGKYATFSVEALRDGRPELTPYHGRVMEFSVIRQSGPHTFYGAVLGPRMDVLTLERISEVYTGERSIPELLEKILYEKGFPKGQDVEVHLSGEYRTRSFVCQYEETTWDFLARWCEQEGISLSFRQEPGKEVLVMYDSPRPIGSPRPLVYRPASELDTGVTDDSVQEWILRERAVPKEVVVQEYNYRKAHLSIRETAEVSSSGTGTVTCPGENVRTQGEAKRLARLRAEALAWPKETWTGRTTATGIRAGSVIAMERHFHPASNGRFQILEVRHEGSQAATLLSGTDPGKDPARGQFYHAEFVGIPAGTSYRPQMRTPKPRIAGTLPAIVEAEGTGTVAELNQHGEYKVRFPFAKTERQAQKNSAWIRQVHPASGEGNGVHFPLRKGDEVQVAFQGGDPDRPVILGGVHTSEKTNLVNHNNPTQHIMKTHYGNTITMFDNPFSS